MGKRNKKGKENDPSADYEQFRQNLEFIEQQIETAKHLQQRREVTRLKLKRLIMKLSYGAQVLETRQIDAKGKRSRKDKL